MAEVAYAGYGKNDVRLMRVRREGDKYSVTELKVNIELQLVTTKDYLEGDNSDVVATDSQKNTVMALARQNTIESPEGFGLLLCRHFLETYQQVIRCQATIEQAPWQRVKQGGAAHNHAFILEPSVIRFCCVSQQRGAGPSVTGGLKEMKIFKATQSGFEGFVRDRFTSLPETNDRAFCTKVYLKYHFKGSTAGVDYNGTWEVVKNAVLDVFAGPPYTGSYSPSAQNTMFLVSELIFGKVAGVDSIDMEMPNIHYFVADLRKINIPNAGELLLPTDTPHGIIAATFCRKSGSKL